MVARKFVVRHEDSSFDVDYDTEDGLEVLRFQIFSLTLVPPEEQKIVVEDDDRLVSDESDLASISEKLRLISIGGDSEEISDAEMVKSDEELARMLQAEEDAMMLQQFVAARDSGGFEGRVRPCVSQVLMYEDPVRQEAARKTVPKDELEEKALVSLAKLLISNNGEDETEVVKETYETNQRSEEFGKVRIDLSEKKALLKEIAELKSKLQPTKSTDNLRSSLLLRSFQMRKSTDFTKNTENNSEALEKEPERWREMESEWISLTDDLRMDIDNHHRHAADLEIELKKVKMATEELNDALGRAMFGHSSSKNKLNELDANPSLTEFELITH